MVGRRRVECLLITALVPELLRRYENEDDTQTGAVRRDRLSDLLPLRAK